MDRKKAIREDLNSLLRRVLPTPDENQLFDFLHAALRAPKTMQAGMESREVQARKDLFDMLCELANNTHLPSVVDRLMDAHSSDPAATRASFRTQMYFLAMRQVYHNFITRLIASPAKPDILQACSAELQRLLWPQQPLQISVVDGRGIYSQQSSRDLAIQSLVGWLNEDEIWPTLKTVITIHTVPANLLGKQADLALRTCAVRAALQKSSPDTCLGFIKACLKPMGSADKPELLPHALDIRAHCVEELLGRLHPASLKIQVFEFFLKTLHTTQLTLAETQKQRALLARIFSRTAHELSSELAHKCINALLRRMPNWPDPTGWHDLAQVLPCAFRALIDRLNADSQAACLRTLRDDRNIAAVKHDMGALAPRCLALSAVYMSQSNEKRWGEINTIFMDNAKAASGAKNHVAISSLIHRLHLTGLVLQFANNNEARRLRLVQELVAAARRTPRSAHSLNKSLCRTGLAVFYSTLSPADQRHIIETMLTNPRPGLGKMLEAAALISDTHPMNEAHREFDEVLEIAINSGSYDRADVKVKSHYPDSSLMNAGLADRLRGKCIAWLARYRADAFSCAHLTDILNTCATPGANRMRDDSLDWLESDINSVFEHLPIEILRRLGPKLLQTLAMSKLPYENRASLIAHLVGIHAQGDAAVVSSQTRDLYAMARASLLQIRDFESDLADHFQCRDSKADSQDSISNGSLDDSGSDGSICSYSTSGDERNEEEDPPSPRPRLPIDDLRSLRYASRHFIALTDLAASMPSDYWTPENMEEDLAAVRAARLPAPEKKAILDAIASLPAQPPSAAGLNPIARWWPLPLRHALQSLITGGQAV